MLTRTPLREAHPTCGADTHEPRNWADQDDAAVCGISEDEKAAVNARDGPASSDQIVDTRCST
jgi:hypothetical protein